MIEIGPQLAYLVKFAIGCATLAFCWWCFTR